MRVKHDTLLVLLNDIRERVRLGDSFEGRLSYEIAGPQEWEVSCAYRIGNENGQGGWRIIEAEAGDAP